MVRTNAKGCKNTKFASISYVSIPNKAPINNQTNNYNDRIFVTISQLQYPKSSPCSWRNLGKNSLNQTEIEVKEVKKADY